MLNEISDDFEEPQHIFERLSLVAQQGRFSITQEDVRHALTNLVQSGLARAYRLALGEEGEEIQGVPPIDRVDEYYYWITDEGRTVRRAFDGWPYDDCGDMLPGWHPPSE